MTTVVGMTRLTNILLTATVSAVAALGVASIVVGDESPPPVADDTVTYVPEPWEPPYTEPVVPTDELIFHEPGTFATTPQHDQCWRNDDVNILLESGDFVIYGNDDPRRWGTHSIGAMNCGPADLPMPIAATVAAEPVAVGVDPAAEPACNP